MLGIVPAVTRGTGIQPLASSQELLSIGEGSGAVAEYVLERLVRAGADRICIVVAAGNSNVADYFGARFSGADLMYVEQPKPRGPCDALFRASAAVDADEPVAVGLPDTVWFPEDALAGLPDDVLSLLLFPVEHPELFDAVILDDRDRVIEVRVRQRDPGTNWICGAFKMPGHLFHLLHTLWLAREPPDRNIGTLLNAYLAAGGRAFGSKAGESYMDVGTLHGYFDALLMLGDLAGESSLGDGAIEIAPPSSAPRPAL